MKNIDNREEFLFGGASASYQCEGAWDEDGKVESMWDVYLHENNYENGDVASDHYHRYKEDIRMMKEGGQNAYRFSIAWPRIIKNLEGDVIEEGIRHYIDVLDECHRQGIEPYVTLYHWDLPQYLEDIGGWINPATADAFVHYAEVCFKAFEGKIDLWTTFNEPKWFTHCGYMAGNYPPEHHNPQEYIQCCYNVMVAHAKAVDLFRREKVKGKIGIVMSTEPMYPIDDKPETLQAVRNADNYANNWVCDPACKGEFPKDMVEKIKSQGFDLSFVKQEDLDVIARNRVDFLGCNYYGPVFVKVNEEGDTCFVTNNSGARFKGKVINRVKDWYEYTKNPNLPITAWGTQTYPKGIYELLMKYWERYQVPLYITENGIGLYEDISVDQIQDDQRIDYIDTHVREIIHAMKDGADVRGYFTWSPFDLYSWKNGCEKRYGLVGIDFENGCVRKPKKSYYWYKEAIEKEWK